MTGGGAERRVDRRLDTDLPVTVRDGATTPGRLVNISRGGAAIRIERAPMTGISGEVSVRVEAGPARGLLLRGALLATSARGHETTHLLHIRFAKLMPAEERALATLMNAVVPPDLRTSGLLPALGDASEGYSETQIDDFFLALKGPAGQK